MIPLATSDAATPTETFEALLKLISDHDAFKKRYDELVKLRDDAQAARDEAQALSARTASDQATADRRYDDAVKVERGNAAKTADLEKREADIAAKVADISGREDALANKQRIGEQDLARRKAEMDSREADLDQREQAVASREQAAARAAAELADKLAKLKQLAG